MKITSNAELAELTSLGVGGLAENLVEFEDHDDIALIIAEQDKAKPLWILGYGTNTLISDAGLPGTVIRFHQASKPIVDGTTVTAEAGMQWDELVQFTIANGLWGLELTSGVPGGVGAAVVINVTAYGQRVSEVLAWAEVLDPESGEVKRLSADDFGYSYKDSKLHAPGSKLIVLKAAFNLAKEPTKELEYESARKVATELGLDTDSLADRRTTILEARRRAGAIYDESDPSQEHTAGSFFKNPLVSAEKAAELAEFEEKDITTAKLLEQNRIHGGEARRVSAAHVLLAAGFTRGQAWGSVRLHPEHVLKLENTGGATAQQIYDVAQEIMATVQDRLGIELEPEVRFLGEFGFENL
jgi:UDP-N-acetylmuramate dehydrogenase